jgi:hypothetical protein
VSFFKNTINLFSVLFWSLVLQSFLYAQEMTRFELEEREPVVEKDSTEKIGGMMILLKTPFIIMRRI